MSNPAPSNSSPSSSGSSSAAKTTTSDPLFLVNAYGAHPAYQGREPSTIAFSADSTNIATHLTWSPWGPSGATGRGTVGLDNCSPNCAAGHINQIPVKVVLGGVSGGHFTTMTETASGFSRTYSYPSNWATSAS